MFPSTIKAAAQQRGTTFFTADAPEASLASDTIVCHNLRTRSPGILERTGFPATIGSAGGKPFIADRRQSGTYLLRQEDDGSIMIDGVLDPDDSGKPYRRLNINLGDGAGYVAQAETAGSFIVIRYTDGTLGYILYNPDLDSYTLLGSLPDMPRPVAEITSPQRFAATVDAVTFRKPVDDLRDGLDTTAKAALGNALQTAWNDICSRAAKERYFLQPVTVRVALRLYDGRLLYLSDPVRPEGTDFQNGGRATFMPVTEEGKVTGTSVSEIGAEGYRLRVSLPGFDLGVWAAVVRNVEVWASREPDAVDSSSAPLTAVTAGSHGTAMQLIAQLPMKAPALLEEELAAQPYAAVCRADTEKMPETLEVMPKEGATYQDAAMLTPQNPLPRQGVCRILGHDGFLHLATPDGLMTSRRGNPFVMVSSTPGDMRDVCGMAAQIWGGGAYTRQIIYVARENCVGALAHNLDGRHTTFRTICGSAPVSPLHICRGNDCVYMLLDGTGLARFEGTKCRMLLRGIEGCRAIFFDAEREELWLVPSVGMNGSRCVVLGPGLADDISTRTRTQAGPIPGTPGHLMLAQDNGVYCILALRHQTPRQEDDPCRWLARVAIPEGKRRMKSLEAGIYGDDVDAHLALGHASEEPGFTGRPASATYFHIEGKPRGRIRLALRPEAARKGTLAHAGEYRIEIRGRFDSLGHTMIK